MQAADLSNSVRRGPAISKPEIIDRIFRQSVGPLHVWCDPVEPPFLGEVYSQYLEKLRSERDRLFASIRSWLDGCDEDWLEDNFSSNGQATSDLAKQKQAAWSKEAERFYRAVSLWYHVGLGQPGLMADFDYWGKMAKYEVSEVTLLSLGLEPTPFFKEGLRVIERNKRPVGAANTFAVRQLEVFKRKFAPHGLPDTVYPEELAKWMRTVELDCHPAFLRMIDTIESRLDTSNAVRSTLDAAEPDANEKLPENRILVSLTKLIIAMAVDGYGYVPNDKRSKIPKEIEGVTDRLGVSVSHDTIRKYLRMGAAHLPKDD